MSLKDQVLSLANELAEPRLHALATRVHMLEFELKKTKEELEAYRESAHKATQATIDDTPPAAGQKNASPEGHTAQLSV